MDDSGFARVTEDGWIGRVLDGRYRLEQRIAAGGFGTVYRGTQIAVERPVAVKLLHRALADDGGHSARFRREARALAQLRHPAIVQVFDFGALADETCYMVMELLEGETLAAHLERHGPLAPDRVIDIGVAILEALAEAHAQGVVHQDLKPDNVIITRRGERTEVKLVDFGIAELARDDGHDPNLAWSRAPVGSPRYLSPEQAADLPVSERADIYSLGAVLYELLTGRPAFSRTTVRAYISAHLDDPPDPPVRHGVAVRGRLIQTLTRFMAKVPGERPSARAAAALLESCRGEALVEPDALEPRARRAPIVIGRHLEQAAFERLADGELRVLTFVGPGGVGKTTLLALCAERARDRGLRVKWLDGAELATLGQLITVSFGPIIDDPPDLLVIDRAERIGSGLDALHDGVLPELPARTRVLMASRVAPGWTQRPRATGAVLELTLENLSAPESYELLEQRGVPEHLRGGAWDETRGFPLTLALMGDLLNGPDHAHASLGGATDAPTLLRRLAAELVDHVPSEAHLRGLLAASLVRRLTEDDLAEVIPPAQLGAVGRWLASLSCARARPDGIELHDLTRKVFLGQARLAAPEQLAPLFEPMAQRALERLRRAPPATLQARLLDIGYLVGQAGGMPYAPFDLADLPPIVAASARHWPGIEALLERFEGPRAVATLRRWRGPHCHAVVAEDAGSVIAFAAGLRLDAAPPALVAADPGTAALARVLFDERGVSRARESLYFRFWAGQHHHLPSPTQTLLFYYFMRLATTMRNLGAMVTAHHPPEFWRPLHAASAHELFESAAFELDGRGYVPFGRDFSELPRREWLVAHFEAMLVGKRGAPPRGQA